MKLHLARDEKFEPRDGVDGRCRPLGEWIRVIEGGAGMTAAVEPRVAIRRFDPKDLGRRDGAARRDALSANHSETRTS